MKKPTTLFSTLGKIEGLTIAAVLVVLFGAFMIAAPRVFLGYQIYGAFLQTVPPELVLAVGLTLVITAGEIDLSFPAVVAFSGFLFAWGFSHVGSSLVGLLIALAGGGLVGYLNGFLVARLRVPSIMATLASQFFWYGVTILLAGGLQYNMPQLQSDPIHTILTGRLFGVVPTEAFWSLGITVLFWFILNRHVFGEAIMFIGDNPNVARVMGIRVEATRIKLFTVMGVLAAVAGLLLTSEMNVFFPTQGEGFLLSVMAAVFIGGTSIAGGVGLIAGTFFGAYIIGSLQAGVVASGIGGYWVQLVEGVVMAASVVLNIVIGEGRFGRLSRALRRWTTAPDAQSSPEGSE